MEDEIDRSEGREPNDFDNDQQFIRYECHCHLDLPGFEDPDGIGLPYIVTVDKENSKTLAIYRNWKEDDERKQKIVRFVHYKFLPGLGFYGFGFIHIIGGLAGAATGTLRAFLDAAMLANMGGGYRSRDARLTGGGKEVKIGEWNEVSASAAELKNAFFPFPNKPPDKTLFEILGYLTELGQRVASTTETVVGDANNNAPVGTTLALIEQGLKIFSGIHARVHAAQGEEFKILAQLDAEYLPPMYPYEVPDAERGVMRADFDERVDVLPVSDPNIISSTQRIALGQSVLQLVSSAPQVYGKEGMRRAHRQMLQALRAPGIDELLPEEEAPPPRMDPVNENMAMMTGKPVQSYVEQAHEAHMAVHGAVLEQVSGANKKDVQAAITAHNAEHMAHIYRIQVEQQLGYQVPLQEYPPEIEARIAEAVAMQTQVALPSTEPQQEPSPEAMKGAESIAKIERDDLEAAAGIERDDMKTLAEIERAAAKEMAAAGREAVKVRSAGAVQ